MVSPSIIYPFKELGDKLNEVIEALNELYERVEELEKNQKG